MNHFISKMFSIIQPIIMSLFIFCTGCSLNPEFKAKLVEADTKKPVSKVRVILANKTPGKPECTINTNLSAVSDNNGDVLIKGIPKGEYVIFYNMSGSLNEGLQEKKIEYGTSTPTDEIVRTLGSPVSVMAGGRLNIVDGKLVV